MKAGNMAITTLNDVMCTTGKIEPKQSRHNKLVKQQENSSCRPFFGRSKTLTLLIFFNQVNLIAPGGLVLLRRKNATSLVRSTGIR